MSNKTIFTLIGVALLFWAMKGIKNSSLLNRSATTHIQQIDWRNADYRPYQRGDLENDPEEIAFRDRQKSYKLAKANTFTNAEVGAKKPTAAQVIAKTDAKDKKKKKKKKAERKAPPFVAANLTPPPKPKAEVPKTPMATFNPPPTGAGPAIPEPQNDEQKAFDEWSRLLLARPDQVLTDRFIREFQSNLVTAAVFYAVIDLMYKEDDTEFKELAVRAAGSVATLQSYDFLLAVLSKENGGSTVANLAQKELYEYESPIALHVLRAILTSRPQDETAVGYAVQTLETSTNKFLTTAPETKYDRLFASFVVPLQKIIAVYTAASNIGASAQRALTRIRANVALPPSQTADQNPFIDDPQVVAGF